MGTGVSFITLFSFLVFIYTSIGKPEEYYSYSRLYGFVTLYSLLTVCLFWWFSIEMTGNTFIFSERDARLYEKVAMTLKDCSWANMIPYLTMYLKDFEDWGGPVAMSILLRIVPDKIFMNLCYILVGGFTALLIFRIGLRMMSQQNAFLAALTYSISSFNIFFYGTFVKETIFIFLIVLLFNSLYRYIDENHDVSIIYVIVYSILLCFFRPAVTVFIWFGIFTYFLFLKGGSITKVVILAIVGIAFIVTLSFLQHTVSKYTLGGDIGHLLDTKESTQLSQRSSYFLNFFAACFGPFPTLFGTVHTARACIYGPGLYYKLFLMLPFVLAIWKLIQNRMVQFYPMLVFIVIEILSVAVVQRGFELRLTLPHLFLVYILVFWYLDKIQEEEENCLFHRLYIPVNISVFLIVMAWNILRQVD